ncbi:MAG: hypothetical protein RL021_1284 [Bacteroidota bacterium]|jgi:gliding motility-associated lipoprotein GldH
MRFNSTVRTYGIFLLLSFLALTGCDRSAIVDEHIRIENESWSAGNVLKMEAEITDTVLPHDIYINLRHSGSYRFSNLFLFLDTYTPSGQHARDTVELTLADERGEWSGDGLGDVRDNRILFRKGFIFPASGTYRFELAQAMRVDPLPGILDAGIRIEHSK